MNKWLGGWTKDNYPSTCKDLCTCFIARGMNLAQECGYEALITSDTCMYISSFEKMRKEIIERASIIAFTDTRGTNAHPDVFDANAGWVLWNRAAAGIKGSYFKLNHPIAEKEARLLEALANPDCGWFFRTSARRFGSIPGNVIAYWASDGVCKSFLRGIPIAQIGQPRQGLATGRNDLFVRVWWEVSRSHEWFDCPSVEASKGSGIRWFPYNKGGEYRKWYGNNEWIINWENNGSAIKGFPGSVIRNPQCYFKPCISWSKISSGSIAFRYKPAGHVFDVAGTSIFSSDNSLLYLLGACNSTVILEIASMLSPTLNFEVGQIATYPIIVSQEKHSVVCKIAERLIEESRCEWDCFETSWDFHRHPLL